MNKSYHALMTLCCLVSFHANAKYSNGSQGKLSIKPSISLGINKRTMTGSISHSTYTGDLTAAIKKSGNTAGGPDIYDNGAGPKNYNLDTLTKNFIKNPFADPDGNNTFTPSTTTTGDTIDGRLYKGPGRVYIESSEGTNNTTWTLKKAGTNDNAATTDAIPGTDLIFLSNTIRGNYTLPVASLGAQGTYGSAFVLYKIPHDDLTSELENEDAQYDVRAEDAAVERESLVDFTKTASDIYTLSLNFKAATLAPKKYAAPDDIVTGKNSDSYYIILAGHNSTNTKLSSTEAVALGTLADNNYYNLLSGSNGAITYTNGGTTSVAGSLAYTQDDIEQINYIGMSLGVNANYSLTDFFNITVALDASSPVEKIEHTGHHLHINPEISLNGRAGLLIGNQNGSVGMLYGFRHDRYTSVVKKFTQSGTTATDITHNMTNNRYTIEQNYAISSIVANIRLSDQIDAFFSTTISEKDLTTTDIKVLSNPKPTNVSYDFGLNLNLDEA